MTEGRQTREFNFVEDLADAFVKALTAGDIDGQVINVGCGEEISLRDLAGLVLGAMGDPIVPDFGALAYRPTEIWRMYCDNTKARALLGWEPGHSLEAGIRRTIDWYAGELASGSRFLDTSARVATDHRRAGAAGSSP